MKNKMKYFNNENGGMMLEILLSLAIAATAVPFVMRELDGRTHRAENVRIARDINETKNALERYMTAHKPELLESSGRVVTKVKISDLTEYGNIPKDYDKFQARIIKSKDIGGHIVLSGMVIYDSADISPMRTREIAELGGEASGFVDRNQAHGVFGTWNSRTNIFDARFGKNSVVEGTNTILSGGDFLWRVPSKNPFDASMASDLIIGSNDINNVSTIDSYSSDFTEFLKSNTINARKVQITPRAELETELKVSGETLVTGALTSDSRNAEIKGSLSLSNTGTLSKLEAKELWVGSLNLSGLMINGDEKPAILKVSNIIDITRGRITATTATVGYTGSVSPKIVVTSRIEDPSNSAYYWDLTTNKAAFSDVSCGGLGKLLKYAIAAESKSPKTDTETIIREVAANNNATISDYTKAISEIQNRVKAKYNNLNLE
jgi:hypothetical protein